MKVVLAASSREISRVPRSVGKSTAFMLELWSSATTIATPWPAIRVTPPTVCGRASATARPPIASPRKMAGKRPQPEPADAMAGGKAAEAGPGDSRPGAFEQPGERHQDQEPEPAGLSKMHHDAPWNEIERA